MSHSVESFNPTHSGDFLFEQREDIRRKTKPSRQSKKIGGVSFYQQEFTMRDGTRYDVTSTVVDNPVTDIGVTETSAWLTRDKGLYTRRLVALGRAGFESTFVSVPKNPLQFGNLEENAYHQLSIARETAEQFGRDPNWVSIHGISRGANTGLAAAAIATRHKMGVMSGDYIAPCLLNGATLKENLKDLPNFLANEIDLIRELGRIPLRALRHYPQTLDYAPHRLFQQLKEVPTLVSGAVGELIDEGLPPETFGYVTVFEGDMLSQPERWQKKFHPAMYPNMVVDFQPGGGHLSCAGEACHTAWLQRVHALGHAMEHNGEELKASGPREAPTRLYDILTAKSPAFGAQGLGNELSAAA